VRLITLAAGPYATDKDDLQPYVPAFLEAVRRFQRSEGQPYDIIHSHYWLSGAIGRALAGEWRVPHLTMFHTLGAVKNRSRRTEHEPESRIREEALIAAGADRIIVGSEHERPLLAQLYNVSPAKVTVVPLGVDLDQFRPLPREEARRALGLEAKKTVLFVGRVEPLKGLDILLVAAAQLAGESDFQLLVVGADSSTNHELAHAGRLAATLGLSGRVHFVGSVDHARLPLYYNAADVCAVPSYYESFGLVAVEAMACGVPVVAARVGGLISTVRDGETGYLIPWHCPEPFAERLELLLMNEDLRRHLGRRARAVAEQYRWSTIANRIAGIYEELLAVSQ
jgi:D-inositol-3-phosphate glycosyltransferase